MELCNCFISINKRPPNFFHTVVRGSIRSSASTSNGHETTRVKLAEELQRETERTLEWQSVCLQVSNFTSTSMGLTIARNGNLPFGRSREESQKLLNQTTAALLLPRPLNFSGIEDISDIVSSSVLRQLRTINELCAVKSTLRSARELYLQLKELSLDGDSIDRYSPLLEILDNCDFVTDLEQKIGFCIDCNLSVILDRASEDLEIIRLERKRNMENLESLLKEVSTKIFQAGGIDTPLVTKRRSRMCVGVRASHKFLLQDGVVLDISSSGATYFMEPRDAVELNNMEVRLSSSENDEKLAIISLLTSEIAESERKIKYLLERILEVDFAFARASYAQWMNGVCPILGPEGSNGSQPNKTENSLSVDIEGIQHPLLLESSLRSLSTDPVLESGSSIGLDRGNRAIDPGRLSEGGSDFPVPIDIKVRHTVKVVVISGPNTGGKTASMKTLGLASLMSKAGMYLPAKNYPRLPWFDLVLADIGDHQSLEQNLSTFSGHILRICKILEVTSKQSLVLIDEIGNGTDPSEGVALSASILQYLKDRVNLAVVTTHYADLSSLKDKDPQFENAAMEFCLETLKPTYHLLWGSKGDSNALSIAKSIGFDQKVLDRAQKWLERLEPNNQTERKALLYQSLLKDRSMLEARARRAASLHSEIMELYHEIQGEAEDLDRRLVALKAKETLKVRHDVKAAKSQIDAVVQNFENQLRSASPDQFNILTRKSEATIASIVEDHCRSNGFAIEETNCSSYMPQIGEQVHVMGLGDKLATVVEAPGDDGTILVQYGKMRVRVKQNSIKAPPSRETASSATRRKRQGQPRRIHKETAAEANKGEEFSYGPVVQTSKNTLDLRGMRVDEASRNLNMAIAASRSRTVLFVIHGMGTGVVKEQTLEILRNHPRIAKFEQESPMNYGCTIAYIK
ncbi:endonuclease MutS2 [Macadamia integrifolia]|uniref:endonuclease MutS2 n=1 Tax=Macadamia integrifolia TaxID=60698 RepID=UPI001C52CC87|nr:endonuclease MutS2 [Macadamia integrifolia]